MLRFHAEVVRHMKRSVLLAAAAAVTIAPGSRLEAQLEEPPYHAIQNARLVLGNGEVIERGTLVMERGLITTVGPENDSTIPPEARVIDGEGLTVYPGLIDSMTDIGLSRSDEGNRRGRAERGSAPDASEYSRGPEARPGTFTWRAAADHLNTEDARIEKWREAGFTSTLTVHQEGIFPGQASFINLAGDKPEDMVVATPSAFPIRLSEPEGYRGYPGSLMGAFAYVKQLFADATHYRMSWSTYRDNPRGRERPRYDRNLAPLSDALTHQTPILIPGAWAKEVSRALDLGDAIDANIIVYGAHEGYEIATKLKQANVSVLVSANWPKAKPDRDPNAETSLRDLRLRDRAPKTPQSLSEAGVRFAFYSDGADSPASFLSNVKKAVDAGLEEGAAIRALSLSAAEMFGLDDRLGSLETGKIANVLVTRGTLFEENMKIESVFIDGRRFTPGQSADETDAKKTEERGHIR